MESACVTEGKEINTGSRPTAGKPELRVKLALSARRRDCCWGGETSQNYFFFLLVFPLRGKTKMSECCVAGDQTAPMCLPLINGGGTTFSGDTKGVIICELKQNKKGAEHL